MATAEVGDDVFGEDPSINDLEVFAAELVGQPAALFVSSGTQGNLLALLAQCEPQYVRSTRAAGDLAAADPQQFLGYDAWIDEFLESQPEALRRAEIRYRYLVDDGGVELFTVVFDVDDCPSGCISIRALGVATRAHGQCDAGWLQADESRLEQSRIDVEAFRTDMFLHDVEPSSPFFDPALWGQLDVSSDFPCVTVLSFTARSERAPEAVRASARTASGRAPGGIESALSGGRRAESSSSGHSFGCPTSPHLPAARVLRRRPGAALRTQSSSRSL